MANSPRYKVFNPSGEYVASVKYLEDGAAIVAAYGAGAELRSGHAPRNVIFREPELGDDGVAAAYSYDAAAELARANEPLPLASRRLPPRA